VALDGLVDVVGDGGSIRGPERLALAVDKGTVQPADQALDDGLDVPTEAPQAGRKVAGKWLIYIRILKSKDESLEALKGKLAVWPLI